MKLPKSTATASRHKDREQFTDEFWKTIRSSAFSLAGVTYLMHLDPQSEVDKEAQGLSTRMGADGADAECCEAVTRIFVGYFWEGMSTIPRAKMP